MKDLPPVRLLVTKYDPARRDARRTFLDDEWTAYCDIGKRFNGVVLTHDEYRRVENLYVEGAISLLAEAGVTSLVVQGPEPRSESPFPLEGQRFSLEELRPLFRRVLRENGWCRFEEEGRAYVHFGYDYYMYVGLPQPAPIARAALDATGLFVEDFDTPHTGTSTRTRRT